MSNPENPRYPTETNQTTIPAIKLGAFVGRDLIGAPVPTTEEESKPKLTVSEAIEQYGGQRLRAEESPWL